MITLDAMKEQELMNKYNRLADSINKYLNSRDSISEGMYLSKDEYKMCADALRNYTTKKGFLDVIRNWFTKR